MSAVFITGTDTDVGKTIATLSLAFVLRQQGYTVGIMKPIQCSGEDAAFLKSSLDIDDEYNLINPYFSDKPLSPHIVFLDHKEQIDIDQIKNNLNILNSKYDFVLVEGAGGLMVPIKADYLMLNLIKDLSLDLIIVSRLGLGTINHSLLTINIARLNGVAILGLIFNQEHKNIAPILKETNPKAVKEFGDVSVLGKIPYLDDFREETILNEVEIDIDAIIKTK